MLHAKFQDHEISGFGEKKNNVFNAEIRNYSIFFWLSLPVHSGSLKRIDYPKQLSGPPSFF